METTKDALITIIALTKSTQKKAEDDSEIWPEEEEEVQSDEDLKFDDWECERCLNAQNVNVIDDSYRKELSVNSSDLVNNAKHFQVKSNPVKHSNQKNIEGEKF